jgi:hypothetical protein
MTTYARFRVLHESANNVSFEHPFIVHSIARDLTEVTRSIVGETFTVAPHSSVLVPLANFTTIQMLFIEADSSFWTVNYSTTFGSSVTSGEGGLGGANAGGIYMTGDINPTNGVQLYSGGATTTFTMTVLGT